MAERNAERQYREHVGLRTICRRRTKAMLASGRLVKGPCEWCGEAEKIHTHHEDYERPDLVRWLCARCHGRVHRGQLVLPSKSELQLQRALGRLADALAKRVQLHQRYPLFVTVAEAAVLIGRSEAEVVKHITAGTVVPFCGGSARTWRIRKRDLVGQLLSTLRTEAGLST